MGTAVQYDPEKRHPMHWITGVIVIASGYACTLGTIIFFIR
ncbi:MAG TPA: hypothetical protein VL282_18625 [Tepidisphaeraceae bacterium]|nr:hypothetical protein [Tepidisphaeraceae bacterium]